MNEIRVTTRNATNSVIFFFILYFLYFVFLFLPKTNGFISYYSGWREDSKDEVILKLRTNSCLYSLKLKTGDLRKHL